MGTYIPKITVPMPGRKGVPREVEGKMKEEICQESKKLSRWPPMMMRKIATALQLNTMTGDVKMRALSWQEHVAAGHSPFRQDCLVCQQSSAKDAHHRSGKEPPRVGVLRLDMTGPFHLGTDLNAKKGKYMLVAPFTWLGPGQLPDDFQEEDPHDVPADAPEIDDPEAEEVEIEDADDVWGERQAEHEQRAKELAEEQLKAIEAQKKNEKKKSRGEDEAEEGEERETPKVVVTRLCPPLPSKKQHDVLKAIIDMYLRLKSDGLTVTQIHTDRGGEFCSEALRLSRTILHTHTPWDQRAC